jgi:hypothetical protein
MKTDIQTLNTLEDIVEGMKKMVSDLRAQLGHISKKQDKVLEDSDWRTSTDADIYTTTNNITNRYRTSQPDALTSPRS